MKLMKNASELLGVQKKLVIFHQGQRDPPHTNGNFQELSNIPDWDIKEKPIKNLSMVGRTNKHHQVIIEGDMQLPKICE